MCWSRARPCSRAALPPIAATFPQSAMPALWRAAKRRDGGCEFPRRAQGRSATRRARRRDGSLCVALTLDLHTRTRPIPAPEPQLTPDEMIARAQRLRPWLPSRQAECEATGNIPQDVNAELIRCGFYRIIQPRRFGGYEFDIATFYKVMMEISRGCAETGWVLTLTAGHPLVAALFPELGQ